MWVKQYKPAMTGNGKHTTYTFMVIWFVFVLSTKKNTVDGPAKSDQPPILDSFSTRTTNIYQLPSTNPKPSFLPSTNWFLGFRWPPIHSPGTLGRRGTPDGLWCNQSQEGIMVTDLREKSRQIFKKKHGCLT